MRKNLLSAALESLPPTGATEELVVQKDTEAKPANLPENDSRMIKIQGPLSELITQELNVIFSRTDPATGEPAANPNEGPSLESQAQDAQLMERFIDLVDPPPAEYIPNTVQVQTVNLDKEDPDLLLEINDKLNQSEDPASEFVVVIDGSANPPTGTVLPSETDYVNINASIESLAESYGVPVVRGARGLVQYLLGRTA